jgi:murein DD-endopeptidase MepM/ murein hydrolase activator NlpD
LFSALTLAILLPTGCPPRTIPPPRGYAPRPTPGVKGTPYTIQSGDTLYSIARAQGIDWRELLMANPSLDPRNMPIGLTIIIPEGAGPGPPAAAPAPARPAMNPGHPGPISAEARFEWPLKGRVAARFGAPVGSREGEPSSGLLIRAAPGRIVTAAKSGQVNTYTSLSLLGKAVVLEHTDGFSSLYGNLDEILVTHGTWVRQGEPIGIAGSSGLSGEGELDFRLWKGGRFVDPLPYLPG